MTRMPLLDWVNGLILIWSKISHQCNSTDGYEEQFLTPDLVYVMLLVWRKVIYMYLFVFCTCSLYIMLLLSKVSPIIIWLFMSPSPTKSSTCIL